MIVGGATASPATGTPWPRRVWTATSIVVASGDFSEDSGERAMRELLARGPTSDAVFAASDLMAVGALRALREAGRGSPTTSPWSASTTPPISRHTEPR